MKTKKKLCQFATILFLLGAIPHSWALQAGAPAEALEEMATADNIETVIKHLPVKVEEYMEKLPVAQRTAEPGTRGRQTGQVGRWQRVGAGRERGQSKDHRYS
jgi:hypothetical protein